MRVRFLISFFMVTLNYAYRGYTRGELTGDRDGYRYGVRLASGFVIYLYSDEFIND